MRKLWLPVLLAFGLLTTDASAGPPDGGSAASASDGAVISVPNPAPAQDAGPTAAPAHADSVTPAPPSSPATIPAAPLEPPPVPTPSLSTMQELYTAIVSKDWFLAAGVVVSILTWIGWTAVQKKWPNAEDHHAIALMIGLAGLGAVGTALAAGGTSAATSSHTLLGALKVFAAAAGTYALSKKGLVSWLAAALSPLPPTSKPSA
jgi:hypothetical protein